MFSHTHKHSQERRKKYCIETNLYWNGVLLIQQTTTKRLLHQQKGPFVLYSSTFADTVRCVNVSQFHVTAKLQSMQMGCIIIFTLILNSTDRSSLIICIHAHNTIIVSTNNFVGRRSRSIRFIHLTRCEREAFMQFISR